MGKRHGFVSIQTILDADRRLWTPEYRFHPKRKWRFDWAWIPGKIAIEQDGGLWVAGAHTRALGRKRDYEKDAEAMLLGWRVFRFAPDEGERLYNILSRLECECGKELPWYF